jgi:hypothetical protein
MVWRPKAELIYGQPQTLWYRAVEGQSSAAPTPTWALYDSDGTTELIAAGTITPTRDTTGTTVSAVSGPVNVQYPRRIYLTSTAGFVAGRAYLLQSTGLPDQWVIPESFGTGYADLKVPLLYDYPIGATLKSTWLSVALVATDLPSSSYLGNSLQQEYVYTVSTVEYTHKGDKDLRIDFVLQDTVTPPLTYLDFEEMDVQRLRALEPGELGPNLEDTINVAWQQMRKMLIRSGVDLQRVADLDEYDEALYYAVLRLLELRRRPPDSELLLQLDKEMSAAIPSTIDYLTAPDDTDRPLEMAEAPVIARVIRI